MTYICYVEFSPQRLTAIEVDIESNNQVPNKHRRVNFYF